MYQQGNETSGCIKFGDFLGGGQSRRIWWENPKERENLEDQDIDGWDQNGS
jgi:hypothetical protein